MSVRKISVKVGIKDYDFVVELPTPEVEARIRERLLSLDELGQISRFTILAVSTPNELTAFLAFLTRLEQTPKAKSTRAPRP